MPVFFNMMLVGSFINNRPEKHIFFAWHRIEQRFQARKFIYGKKSIDNIIKE
jgi:hypothetical protein